MNDEFSLIIIERYQTCSGPALAGAGPNGRLGVGPLLAVVLLRHRA